MLMGDVKLFACRSWEGGGERDSSIQMLFRGETPTSVGEANGELRTEGRWPWGS